MKIIVAGDAGSLPVITQANAIASMGHEVTVVSMKNEADISLEPNQQINIAYLDAAYSEDGVKKNAKQFNAVVSSITYDVLLAFGCDTYGAMAAKAGTDRTLLCATGKDVCDCEANGTKSTVKKSMDNAIAICAPAPAVLTSAKGIYKKEKAYFETPYGVDTTLFKKGVAAPEKLSFGSIRPLNTGCGVGHVIEAFHMFLEKTGTKAALKIAGTGNLEEPLKQTVKSLGIEGSVEFLGNVKYSGLPKILQNIDVLVEMPPEEYYAYTALMAMACEIPVISSETVGASACILNGVTGYLIKPGKNEACANRMGDISATAGSRERMGKLAREDMEPVYNKDVCSKKLMDAINYVAGSR